MKILPLFFFMLPFLASGEVFRLDGVDFHCRVPEHCKSDSGIMVLFGGRNWPGDKTLKTYDFNELADRHGLFLLSPSFRDRDYWEPEKWSGPLLKKAIRYLETRYKLNSRKLYFYGYSAGGQCAALFFQWMPEKVAAVGIHACGVYPDRIVKTHIPVLITCGTEDRERFQISRRFVYGYRERGGLLLWKYYRNSGHGLSKSALELAKVWFDDHLSGREIIAYGEDDTFRTGETFEVEFRNPLYSEKMRELWRE